jgi:hypothetical protein
MNISNLFIFHTHYISETDAGRSDLRDGGAVLHVEAAVEAHVVANLESLGMLIR